jgi:MarR family transcriptional regulator, 2-MHQ and catechol-resistance regulon repressor
MENDKVQLQEVVDQVIYTLPGVWDRIRSKLRASAISNFDITLEQFHILRHIRRGYASVAELAEKKQISRPAVSQAVQILVNKGLVTRQTDPSDRRSIHLGLTPYAQNAMDANFDNMRVWVNEKMLSLSPNEIDQVMKAMKILKRTFNPEESDINH